MTIKILVASGTYDTILDARLDSGGSLGKIENARLNEMLKCLQLTD